LLLIFYFVLDLYVDHTRTVCQQKKMEKQVYSNAGNGDFRLFDDLRCVIQQANNCLLLRQFEDCLDICEKNITIARNYTENER